MRFLIIGFGIAVLGTGSQSTCAAEISQGQSVTSPAPRDSNEASSAVKRIVAWDGEQASKGAGWTNPTTATIKPQTVDAHSGYASLEFKFKGGKEWLGAGWNWLSFKTGIIGTDASKMKNLTFWIKSKGKTGPLQVNLLCNGEVLDTPEEHTEKVQVLKYCPQLLDGQWHEVVIPLAALKPAKGFNPSIISEIHFGFMAEEGTDGSFFIDDIAFDDRVADKQQADVAVRASDEMLVNGSFADCNARWVFEESGATGRAECVKEGPDGKPALRLSVLTTGDKTWRLQLYQTGMQVEKGRGYIMTFWVRSTRDGSITVNCMQNHEPWDHHTQKKMPVTTEWKQLKFAFIAPWDDNNVRISFTDLATAAGQVYWFAECSLVPGPKVKTDETPTPKVFIWKGDCSSEAAYVNSSHPIIPGHYEYLPDPNEPGRGLVFAGHLTPDFTTADPEKFHLHPDIYFDRFIPGSITVSFDVKVDDLTPSELGPYGENPWLNVVTLFDETTRAGGTTFHPSVMVNLVGSRGQYRLQAYSISPAGAGTFFDKLKDAPVFPTGKWVTVRVEANVKTKQVRVYQDDTLVSAGLYLGKPGLAGAHMGLYANRKMTRATVFNDDITITVGD
jgi:hypothetical protein